MKKNRLLPLILALALAVSCLAGCSTPATGVLAAAPSYPEPIAYDDYEAQYQNREDNAVDEEFLAALMDFAVSGSSALLTGGERNGMFSPVSLYYPLALCALGADSGTKTELMEALHLSGFDDGYIADQSAKLFRLLYTDNKVTQLKLANSLWLDEFPFREDFLKTAAEDFFASLYQVDFSDSGVKKQMADWVSENTGGLISPEYGDFSPDLKLMLLNTVYLKDAWNDEFSKNATEEDDFTPTDGSAVRCDFMHKTQTRNYTDGDGWASIGLSTVGGAWMCFVLPDEGVTTDDLLVPETLTAILADQGESVYAECVMSIPKFDFGAEYDLMEQFAAMGIELATNPDLANFSALAEEPLYLSAARQLTHISIDEEGLEAAAYTELAANASGAPPEDPPIVELDFNRPFLFFIRYAGTVLFVGCVENPTAN